MSCPSNVKDEPIYKPKHQLRFLTSTSFADGHDASISIIRRMLVQSSAEVIHLGHSHRVHEIVNAALQEDVHAVAISSYQGGHMEYFAEIHRQLKAAGCGHVKIFGGGGGVIVDSEIEELHRIGITRVYSPEDGAILGYQGMINDMLRKCDEDLVDEKCFDNFSNFLKTRESSLLARMITSVELGIPLPSSSSSVTDFAPENSKSVVLGMTGPGGCGKSSLLDELLNRFSQDFPDLRIAVLLVDPSKRKPQGALLGDRLRLNSALSSRSSGNLFVRSIATRGDALPSTLPSMITLLKAASFDIIFVETPGMGQGDSQIVDHCDLSLLVMSPFYGAPTQLDKIAMIETATLIALNKVEKCGGEDALRAIRNAIQHERRLFNQLPEEMDVYPTMAARFNDYGTTHLYLKLLEKINEKCSSNYSSTTYEMRKLNNEGDLKALSIVPPSRSNYLANISAIVRNYKNFAESESSRVSEWEALNTTEKLLEKEEKIGSGGGYELVKEEVGKKWDTLRLSTQKMISSWDKTKKDYECDFFEYALGKRTLKQKLYSTSLSGTRVPRVILPNFSSKAELIKFLYMENLPGFFPFTSGCFPFKRTDEDPTRMFAGEGTAERTNARFHYLTGGRSSVRLSTAFDSLTLYGADPTYDPDMYGRIGNSGVAISTVEDMRNLFSGFHLNSSSCSTSMTINGPMPIILAMFFNVAIDQRVEEYLVHLKEDGRWAKVQEKIEEKYKALGKEPPSYTPFNRDSLPPGHDGFGLGLAGCSATEVCEWGLLSKAEYNELFLKTLVSVRGTVQSDILKEEQGQNSSIFSTYFALTLLGDTQQFFVDHKIRNFYSISVSGYHIAEAGANPISQLAFTLSNAFAYVEYYLSRGMDVNAFAENFSFFFQIGNEIEFNVLNRVARRIWAIAMKERYGAGEKAQKLKAHIQTSGRSLQVQSMDFNDPRTTLQALSAYLDNCQSLHTNSFDEAISTPTEASVRRALAIQLILYNELGICKNDNPYQGSFLYDYLTDAVEEKVLEEFDRISDRGGVLPAMEFFYQRSKIMDESFVYEWRKNTGDYPVVGVNLFRAPEHLAETDAEVKLMRSTEDEKKRHMANLTSFYDTNSKSCATALSALKKVALDKQNMFAELMNSVRYCSLGQIRDALGDVGGNIRRYT